MYPQRSPHRAWSKVCSPTALSFVAALMLAALGLSARADEQPADGAKPAGQDSRRVWVLTDQGGVASEGGFSFAGPAGVIPYEINCAGGELRSAQRKLTSAGIYGAVAWTVRISGSLASEYGARMLRAALENICRAR